MYCQFMSTTEAQLREDARANAEQSIRIQAAIEQIVAIENLTAEEEEINQAVSHVARQKNMTLEQLKPYVDAEFERRNARQVVVVQGKSDGVLLYDGLTTADVYVRHESEVTIDCSRLSKVFISVYDHAKVHVTQRDGASVYVYLHGDGCSMESEGEVMVRRSKN